MRDAVTQQRLKELLHYDPETGVFTWLIRTSIRIQVGDRAGSIDQGYRSISVDGIAYRAARLAWLYMTGAWPRNFIDHVDNDGANDRWVNLREATNSENMQNATKKVTNKSGYKGVYFEAYTGKYRCNLTVNYKVFMGQRYETPEEAYAEYCALAHQHHGKFARIA